MVRRVQLSIADSQYAAAVREALSRSCAWHVEAVDHPDLTQQCVLVLDEIAFSRLPLPLSNPERIVVLCQPDPQFLAQAWDAGIVSVLSKEDPLSTVLLAIMAADLRVVRVHNQSAASGISPTPVSEAASIAPGNQTSRSKHSKTQ